MKELESFPEVARFLNNVCGQIRARQLHREIREELTVHLEERFQENLACGMPAQEAIETAIARMGEPRQIGRQLNETHRPRTDWVMLMLIALLSGVGLLAMYNLNHAEVGTVSYYGYFVRKVVLIVIGVIAMSLMWTFDYQKLKKYSEYVFGLGIFLLGWVNEFGMQVNGQAAWYFFGSMGFYVPTFAILLMIVGFSGTKPLKDLDWKGSIFLIAYRGFLPVFLLVQINVNTMAAVYALIFMFYLLLTKRNIWQVIAVAASGAFFMTEMVTRSSYLYSRISAFLHWKADPQGTGYQIARSTEALHAAGWWGKGDLPVNLPYLQSEGLLPGMIYSFGWVAGAVIILLILAFIVKTFMASLSIKDEYGKLLFASIGALFALQYAWAAALPFGYAPYVGISLPLLSYGGTEQICHFAALGFLLGIYRRRDTIPSGYAAND